MTVMNASNARQNLFQLISDVNEYSEPIIITNNKGKNAVLISEDDWKSIEETLYLNSIHGMADRIIESAKEELSECSVYSENEEW